MAAETQDAAIQRRVLENLAIAGGLRELADFIERYPKLESIGSQRILNYVGCVEDPKAELAAFARAAGRVEKYADGDKWFGVHIPFGAHVSLDVYAERGQVCTRVVKGTHTITQLVPDPAAEVAMVAVTETVEEVEWVCEPLLAASATQGIAPPALVEVGHEDYPEVQE